MRMTKTEANKVAARYFRAGIVVAMRRQSHSHTSGHYYEVLTRDDLAFIEERTQIQAKSAV